MLTCLYQLRGYIIPFILVIQYSIYNLYSIFYPFIWNISLLPYNLILELLLSGYLMQLLQLEENLLLSGNSNELRHRQDSKLQIGQKPYSKGKTNQIYTTKDKKLALQSNCNISACTDQVSIYFFAFYGRYQYSSYSYQ